MVSQKVPITLYSVNFLIKTVNSSADTTFSSCDYFTRKLKELYQQKGTFYKQASIPSNALLASYEIYITQNREMQWAPYTITEELSLPAAVDMVNLMIGESAGFSALALVKSR